MVREATTLHQIGRYEVLEAIGRGAMGVVFKARDPLIERTVAVKTITAGIAEDPDLLERFRREAKAAGGLQHPNIVTIYEMSDSDGLPFIAMEYLEGESLEKVINCQLPMPLARRLGFMVQACRALDFAHRHGVIHRDIKPANIMVTLEGVVKVVDFGIARLTDAAKTQTGALLGTLYYMPPEQLHGQRADQRSDVWSLGAVLYELLTYRRAFDGENHGAVMMKILQEEPQGIGQFISECPPALEQIVQRALRKDPALRYQSMEALLVDLEPIWTSLQRETVQKLVHQGRQLMETGKLSEAGEVLRQSLLIDTANLSAKVLLDQVNALLGRAPTPLQPPKSAEPGNEKRDSSGLSAPTTSKRQTQQLQEVIPASAPTRDLRNDQPAFVVPAPTSALPRPAGPRPAVAQPRAAIGSRGVARPLDRSPRKRSAAFVIGAVVLVLALAAFGYWRLSDLRKVVEKPSVSLSAPEPMPIPEPVPTPPATTAQPASSNSAPDAVPPASVPTENQQRHLIDLAHEAADSGKYKAAQARLDEAAKLNGPLNPLIDTLRHRFSEEAHGAELQQSARKGKSLWDQAMEDVESDQLVEADKLLRELLILPEGGHRVADAERYVDQVIPRQRHQDELWAQAQTESNSKEPGHLINEIKALDQLLAGGGSHEQNAKEMRDAVMTQFVRNNARRNHASLPDDSIASTAKLSQLENQFIESVQRGDAQALEQLQQLRPQFKTLAEGGGLLVGNARDYQNNLIPKAQKEIEDRLANAESAAAANATYEAAVKHYDQAVATQNTGMLRLRVLPEFQQIVAAGGPRAPEASRYVNSLIPAALKEAGAR
jgi:serine/threonine protein kinase